MVGLSFEGITAACVDAIAQLFGVAAAVEPYTPDGTPVYALDLRGAADGIRVILWPSLARVDVRRAGDHSWVLKNVGGVDVIEGVEVVFRPAEGRGFLFVSVNGFVNMVMG
jgi:hypothetical protein